MNFTKAQQIENCRIALRYWATVPNKNVARQLAAFRVEKIPSDRNLPHGCNTVACFGGWVPAMPEFAAMGVISVNGHPNFGKLTGYSVSKSLFGTHELFSPRGTALGDNTFPGISDHQIVKRRLNLQIKRLSS